MEVMAISVAKGKGTGKAFELNARGLLDWMERRTGWFEKGLRIVLLSAFLLFPSLPARTVG